MDEGGRKNNYPSYCEEKPKKNKQSSKSFVNIKRHESFLKENSFTAQNMKPGYKKEINKLEKQRPVRDFKSMPTLLENDDYDKCVDSSPTFGMILRDAAYGSAEHEQYLSEEAAGEEQQLQVDDLPLL